MKLVILIIVLLMPADFLWSSSSGQGLQVDDIMYPGIGQRSQSRNVMDRVAVDEIEFSVFADINSKHLQELNPAQIVQQTLSMSFDENESATYLLFGEVKRYRGKLSSNDLRVHFKVMLKIGALDKDRRVVAQSDLQSQLYGMEVATKAIESIKVDKITYKSSQLEAANKKLIQDARSQIKDVTAFVRDLNQGMTISVIPHIGKPGVIHSDIHELLIGVNYTASAQVVKKD